MIVFIACISQGYFSESLAVWDKFRPYRNGYEKNHSGKILDSEASTVLKQDSHSRVLVTNCVEVGQVVLVSECGGVGGGRGH